MIFPELDQKYYSQYYIKQIWTRLFLNHYQSKNIDRLLKLIAKCNLELDKR